MANVAFVSGSSRGIGRAIALELAGKGFLVAVNGRKASSALDGVVAEIAAHGGKAVSVPGDASDPTAVAGILDRAEQELGPITALVANAGAGPLRRADILEVTPEALQHCLAANTIGPFFLLQEHARRLVARADLLSETNSITLVSSANAVAASPNKADYCVSKAGAAMIAKLFAEKLSPLGVRVVDIQPGVIQTDLSAAVIDEYRRRIEDEGLALMPRVGQPEDIARVVGCIAGGDLVYVSGSVIRVDGGLAMERF